MNTIVLGQSVDRTCIDQFAHGNIAQDKDRLTLLFLYRFGHRVDETEGITKIVKHPMTMTFSRLPFVAN